MSNDLTPGSQAVPMFKDFWGKASSNVWRFYHFEVDEHGDYIDRQRALCKLCGHVTKYSGNTTNMASHLDKRHPFEFQQQQQQFSQSPIVNHSQDALTAWVKKSKLPFQKTQLINVAIASYLVENLLPLSCVESSSFRLLCTQLCVDYEIPPPAYLRNKVLTPSFHETKETVLRMIGEAESSSLTADTWQSKSCNWFATFTARFIDSQWEPHQFVLTTREIAEPRAEDDVYAVMNDVAREWDMKSPSAVVSSVIRENRSASWEPVAMFLPCICHSVNYSIRNCYSQKSLSALLGKLRKLVAHFKCDTSSRLALLEKQKCMGLPQQELVTDNTIQWKSTADMIERVLEQDSAICAVMMHTIESKRALMLSQLELQQARELLGVLKPFTTATQLMSMEKSLTASLVCLVLTKLKTGLQASASDSAFQKSTKSFILGELSKRYEQTAVLDFLHVAAALDPRCKHLSFLDEIERDRIFLRLKQEALTLTITSNVAVKLEPHDYSDTNNSIESHQLSLQVDFASEHIDEGSLEPIIKISRTSPIYNKDESSGQKLSDWLGDLIPPEEKPSISTSQRIDNEIQTYRSESDLEMDSDPLLWWKNYGYAYPTLSRLAKKYLCVPATSGPSDRVFSAVGSSVVDRRACLDSDEIDTMVFLNANSQCTSKVTRPSDAKLKHSHGSAYCNSEPII
ncbi:E3 SUMO-protein ligase ZBED1-like [Gigantopelta aegis]|uniref:E3 SUMO-protein ligase ZBED1-like n=1 Tax=Gigantopelta aegis TaxID=1735272 RepID=UPI001B888379|nr:E3 SUMO-protein ligase ZBED1-like [Gigantopelta aegis]